MKKITESTKLIIVFFFLLFTTSELFAQNKKNDMPILQFDYKFKQDSVVLNDSKIDDIMDGYPFPNNYVTTTSNPFYDCSNINVKYREPKLVLSLRLGNEDYKLGDGLYNCNLEDIWIGVYDENTYLNTIIIDEIHIESNGNATINPEVLKCIDISTELSSGAIEFQINYIGSYSFTGNIESSIVLEMFLVYEQAFMPRSTSIIDPFVEIDSPKGIDLSNTGNNGLVTFKWSLTQTCDHVFNNYQLQILRLYDMDPNPNNYESKVDWSKAFTFETGNNKTYVSLSMVEGTGFYVWRVRPISNYFDGGIANDRNWGDWSSTDCINNNSFNDGDIVILNKTTPDSYCCGFYYKQFDGDKNWKYVRNFAEGDKGTSVMETIQYADNLLKIRQEQTYISNDSIKLMKQNIYDYVGRKALTTLPFPEEISPYSTNAHLGYYQKLVESTTGDLYSAINFDKSNNLSDNFKNSEWATAIGPSSYYTGNNVIDKNVPSSGVLPYTQPVYSPFARNLYEQDGTGRIKEQSGFGGNHKIGSDKTVKTYYSSVTEDELVPIFGSEAPKKELVHKIINVDQNGVINYTYQLSNGKILATCLNINQTNIRTPLEDLKYEPEEIGVNSANIENEPHLIKTVNEELKNDKPYGENGYRVSEVYSFPEPTIVTFRYTLNPKKINLNEIFCFSYCPTCDYFVKLVIKEKESGAIVGQPVQGQVSNNSENCDTPLPLDPPLEIVANLSPGSYVFERYIFVKNKISGSDLSYLDLYKNELQEKILEPNPPPTLMNTLQSDIFDKLDDIFAGIMTLKEFYDYLDEQKVDVPASGWSYNETDKIYTYENNEFCCGNIAIPKYECPECEGYPTVDPNGNPDFEKYLLDKEPNKELNELFFDYDGGLLYPNISTYVNGKGAFNQLIYNMLNDPSGCYQPCQLWNCWQSIVDVFDQIAYKKNPSGNLILNTDFHLLDHFLACTGKMYVKEGSNNPYNSGNGYLLYAYKYFKDCTTEQCEKCKDMYEEHTEWGEKSTWRPDECGVLTQVVIPSPDKKWEAYYNCINSIGKLNNSDSYDPDNNVPQNLKDLLKNTPDADDIIDYLADLKSECESDCLKKFPIYVDAIIQEFNKQYKSVVGQHHTYSGTTVVTLNPSQYDSKWHHQITRLCVIKKALSLVKACKMECPTINVDAGPPIEILDWENKIEHYKKAKYGHFVIKLPGTEGCPLGYENSKDSSSNDKIIEAAVSDLNQILQNEVIAKLNNDGRPYRDTCKIFQNYITLSKAYTAIFGTKPCFGWLDSCGLGSGGDSTVAIYDSIPYGYKAHYYDPDDSTFFDGFCFQCDEYGQYKKDTTVSQISLLGADRFFQKSIIELFLEQGMAENDPDNPYYLYQLSSSYPSSANRYLGNWIYAFFPDVKYEFIYHNGKLLLKNTIKSDNNSEYSNYFHFGSFLGFYVPPGAQDCNSDICYKWVNDILPEIETGYKRRVVKCDEKSAISIETDIKQQIQKCIDEKKHEIEINYNENCLDGIDHLTTLSYDIKYYHYTLYYYDRAGNLVKTVPPKGVDINPTRDRLFSDPFPDHKYGTTYFYNSISQLVSTHNPDFNQSNYGTHTDLYYDLNQHLRFSQEPNQKQANQKIYDYSYTHYDELGRVIESGEFSPYITENFPTALAINEPVQVVKAPPTNAYPPNPWKKLVVKTFYSRPALWIPAPYSGEIQRNIDNRVSFTFRDADGKPQTAWDQVWTFYSYDAHGNVEWVIHKLPFNIVTKVDYEYDLISGKVKRIYHNKDRLNEFYYQYRYDSDNRLTEVYTSRHGELWEKDAGYKYYKHGPLKRIELGEDKIQGVDYAYTINGWLKAINGGFISPSKPDTTDLGKDGYIAGQNKEFSYDEFGQQLSYFDNDYYCNLSPLNKVGLMIPKPGRTNLISMNTGYGLYNGNISAVEYSFGANTQSLLGIIYPNDAFKNGYRFKYDVLGRLKDADFYVFKQPIIFPPPPPPPPPPSPLSWYLYSDSAYSAHYRYDPNGNMKYLRRLGVPGLAKVMDDLSYNYGLINTLPSNRLTSLVDAGTVANPIALKNTTHNYSYDHSGNLTTDLESEISQIKWTADGKVERITKTSGGGGDIVFIYDARGDRICKASLGTEYEYYLRDANGEILEILKIKAGDIPGGDDNDPWRIVDGHPHWSPIGDPPSIKPKEGNIQNKKSYDLPELQTGCCPVFECSEVDSVFAPWTCWEDTTSLDIIDENNPFLDPDNQVGHNYQYVAKAKNEWYIYGSSSHGRFARAIPYEYDRWGYSNEILSDLSLEKRYMNQKQYELKDHLGNVRVVISDLKISTTANDTIPPFKTNVLAAYNHYPFGMLQPGMYSEAGTPYRFGFNGMLRDDEVKDLGGYTVPPNEGVGNSYDFGARLYDPRVARWFSQDKIKKPFISPYVYASNNPIAFIDPDGNDDFYYNKKGGLFGYTANSSDAHRIFRENSSGTYQLAGKNYLLKMITDKEVQIAEEKSSFAYYMSYITGRDQIWLNNGTKPIEYYVNGIGTVGKESDQISGGTLFSGRDAILKKIKGFFENSDYDKTIDWMKADKSFQEHHIIPKAMLNEKLIQLAIQGGFDINGENNKVYLPTKLNDGTNFHNGYHSNYSNWIRTQLNMINTNDPEQARRKIEELIPEATNQIYNAAKSNSSLQESFNKEK